MFHVLFCSCLCVMYWSKVLSREWRCSWSSVDRRCSNYIWVINNFILLLRRILYQRYYGLVAAVSPVRLDMMTSSNGNIFHVTGPLLGESTGHWWIPLTKASDVELWCFPWSAPEQTVEEKIETPVIWDANMELVLSITFYFHYNIWGCMCSTGPFQF